MMFKKKLLASAMATALVAGAVVSGSAQAIRISENGAGQVLMGSLYMTTSGFSSNITVVNSSTTDAVKARLSLRSQKHSDECRDVVLYLTPGDVFRGQISMINGVPTLTSSDDSIIASMNGSSPVFATPSAPYKQPIGTPTTDPVNDTCAVGHMEIIGAYAAGPVGTAINVFNPATSAPLTPATVTIASPMSKYELYKVFMTPRNLLATQLPKVQSMDDSRVRLQGVVEVTTPSDRALYPMTALRAGVNPGTGTVSTTPVGHELFDVTVGATLNMGLDMGYNRRDNITDIEYAIATTNLSSSYEHGGSKITNMEVTYPTKYRHRNNAATPAVPLPASAATFGGLGCSANTLWPFPPTPGGIPLAQQYSTPWYVNGAMQYGLTSWDDSENSVSPVGCFQSPCGSTATTFITDEVNYIDVNGLARAQGVASIYNSTSGWFRLTNMPAFGCGYAGAPAIAYSHRFDTNTGNSVFEPMGRDYQ